MTASVAEPACDDAGSGLDHGLAEDVPGDGEGSGDGDVPDAAGSGDTEVSGGDDVPVDTGGPADTDGGGPADTDGGGPGGGG